MTTPTEATVNVRDLRVGMFVHLDLGWMSHPFPLSSFLISSSDQIATINELGLSKLRWVPERSDPTLLDSALASAPEASQGHGTASAPPGGHPPETNPEQAAAQARRNKLAAQRQSLLLCERQYAEATRALRQTSELVQAEPAQARQRTEAFTRALLDKMLGERDLCIRTLNEGVGDRSSAHALNVTVISLLMGRLFGMSDAEMMDLGVGSLMHDIGKLDLPDRVRHIDDDFTGAEAALYREHVAHGVTQGRKMGLTPGALLVIAQHHEQGDSSGFPLRLNLDRMTAAARIVALVNRYDNLCNPLRPGTALTPHEALSQIFAQGKHKFDTAMLSAFIRMMGVYPPGSVVQLTDDRYAIVTTVNSSRPLKPQVMVHDPKVPSSEALYLNMEKESSVGIRRSLKVAQLPADALAYLAPSPRVAYFFEPAPLRDEEKPA
jgi:HD-GYP domain-containing protein (c-di-GMP phosphodiesterase class II)